MFGSNVKYLGALLRGDASPCVSEAMRMNGKTRALRRSIWGGRYMPAGTHLRAGLRHRTRPERLSSKANPRYWSSSSSSSVKNSSTARGRVDESAKRAKEAWAAIEQRITREGSFVEKKAVELFNNWKQRYTWKHGLFFTGLGGTGILTAVYLYFSTYPTEVEKIVVNKTLAAFANALDFDARKLVYFSLPERNFPVPTTIEELIALANSSAFSETGSTSSDKSDQESSVESPTLELALSGPKAVNFWSRTLGDIFSKLETGWLIQAKRELREKLLIEIKSFPALERKIEAIQEVVPPSLERTVLIHDELAEHLRDRDWLDKSILEACVPRGEATEKDALDLETKLITSACAFFPGPTHRLVQYLESRVTLEYLLDEVESSAGPGLDRRELERTLAKVREHYRSLHPKIRAHVLHKAMSMMITAIFAAEGKSRRDGVSSSSGDGNTSPYHVYVGAIDEALLAPLRADKRINERILVQASQVFFALPSEHQARLLLTAILHPDVPDAGQDLDVSASVSIIRDLLSSGGIVAVKLAQMLAEDPEIPSDYRELLGSLRDENEPMSAAEFWAAIPSTVRDGITSLGRCLGTGSVKQVHVARFKDGEELALGVLRNGVASDALASITAMQHSEELGSIARRLGRLVYGELNMFTEGEALAEFASTSIGRNKWLRVVRVRHHSPRCLVEEIAEGRSIPKIMISEGPEAVAQVKKTLTEYHRAVFKAFVDEGFIHSDIHLGNALTSPMDPSAPAGMWKLTLFDVGQFDKIGIADTKALLWTLCAISTIERRHTIRGVALSHLASVCKISSQNDFLELGPTSLLAPPPPIPKLPATNKAGALDDVASARLLKRASVAHKRHQDYKRKRSEELRKRLEDAFDEAIEPLSDGTLPDQRKAYMLFLRAAEKRNVELPKGAFSVAKMIDGIKVQQDTFDLPPVLDDNIEAFLRRNMTWGEMASIFTRGMTTAPPNATSPSKAPKDHRAESGAPGRNDRAKTA